MTRAKNGDRVRIHYTGRRSDGDTISTSREGDPLEFELGSGDVIPGVEEAVEGMSPGDTREVSVPPEKAFGPVHEELVIEIPMGELPVAITPKVGMRLGGTMKGKPWTAVVREIKEESVLLDANHPLAGETLEFEIEMVEILSA